MPSPFSLTFELLGLQQVVGGFERIGKIIDQADRSIGSIAAAIRTTGGSAADVGAVGGFARLGGHDPAEAGNLARGLRERIASSPLAQGAFGVGVLPASTGQLVNEAKLYRQIASEILTTRSDEEARMKAQIAGMEELLPMRAAEPRLIREAIAEAERRGRLVDRDLQRERANLEVLRGLRESAFDRLAIKIERETLPIAKGWERIKEAAADTAANRPSLLKDVLRIAGAVASGQATQLVPIIGEILAQRAGGGKGTGSPKDANTRALQEMTVALVALKREYLNDRGGRAGKALPGGLRGPALDRYLENAARDLGAVTF